MKKTRILLVLAIAMLAMFAMSACTLIASGIEKVEFEVMPKNYFSVNEIKSGLNVGFTAYTTEKPEGVEITVSVTETGVEISDKTGIVNVDVDGFSMEMGEHELVVSVNDGVAKATYQYRVCELLDGKNANVAGETIGDELKNALGESTKVTGFYMLAGNAYVDRVEVKRPFVLYGENYAVIKNATINEGEYGVTETGKSESRVINITGDNGNKANLDGGLFELNNVALKNEASMKLVRGISVYNVSGATINFNACDITSDWYAINIASKTSNLTVNISNGTWSTGWAAINTWCSGSVINIDNTTMVGVNTTSPTSSTNNFGTIVINAFDSNVVNMTNSHIVAISNEGATTQTTGGWQDHIIVQGGTVNNVAEVAEYNIINLENCTYSIDGVNRFDIVNVDRENGFRFVDYTESNKNSLIIK